jgi:3-oxoacyl-[acyl-carrier protein] reductase
MGVRHFSSLQVGSEVRWSRTISAGDVEEFATLSGDDNDLHMDGAYARRQGFSGRVVHGMLINAYISRVLGTELPGPGVLWLGNTTRFLKPVYIDDRIDVVVRVKFKSESLHTMVLETMVYKNGDELVLDGEAKVMMLGQPHQRAWEDTVVLVTGASRGIGAAIARAAGCRGAKVVITYHSNEDCARQVAEAVTAGGGDPAVVQGDLSTESGARKLADTALKRFGAVHVLVNNASPMIEKKPLSELSCADLSLYWNVYVQSTFVLCQELVPVMRQAGGGRIINILSSYISGVPPAEMSAYVAAKSGLLGLAKSMSVELAADNITVNSISPSPVLTDQWNGVSESRRRALAMRNPMRCWASPDDVANAVIFLAGAESRFLTGHNMLLTGGEAM